MITPLSGSIWRDNSGTEVQIINVGETLVYFKYLRVVPIGTGLEGTNARAILGSFVHRYTEVDVFEAQNPRVIAGQSWWDRKHPRYTVTVVSVLNGVVTYKYTDTDGDEYDARTIEKFVTVFTNKISAPKDTTDISEWPTHALFKFAEPSNTLHFHCWCTEEDNPRQTYPDMALLKVPIDWTQAIWKVEP